MLMIDTHVHCSRSWYEPVEVLLFQMSRVGFEKAVLTQHKGNLDNRYFIECIRRFPGRFAAVVAVDVARPDAVEELKRLAKEGATGVRLRPVDISPGDDPLLVWRTASQLGLVVSCLGRPPEQYASNEFLRVLEEFPKLPIVVEHLGFPDVEEPAPYNSFRKIVALAKHPNIYIKIPGLGQLCQRPTSFGPAVPFKEGPPFAQMAFEAFGSKRMMFGSDYPPVSQREGYWNASHFLMDHLRFCTQEDKEWIFGKTAISVWKFAE